MTDETVPTELDDGLRRFGDAWAKGDVAVLDALLSPTYTHATTSGKFQRRAEWLAYAAGRTGRQSQLRFADVQTHSFGNVAVVTGRNDVEGRGDRDAAGREDRSVLFTQVWVRGDTGWQREAFHATHLASP
jgi:ketosteroid isomerase-like protein